jgi:glycerol uptake facilitator-like aquaporin
VCDERIGFVEATRLDRDVIFFKAAFDSLMMSCQRATNSEPTFLSFQRKKFVNQLSMGSAFFHEIIVSFFLFFLLLSIADDPYYCGLRARVSNFVKNKNTNEKPVKELGTEIKMKMTPHVGTYQAALSHGHPMQTHQMWHSRSFDSGMGNWL